MNNKALYLIIGTVILLTLLVVLNLLFLKKPVPKKLAPLPVQQTQPITPQPKDKISFQEDKRDQLISKMNVNPILSTDDQTLKKKLVASADKSGNIAITPDYKIQYISAFGLFQVELTNNSYLQAKGKAQTWFKNQGFSKEGICNLPIMFYLSAEVKASLPSKDINFNYLPEGC